jgi:hypothetical protein
MKEAFLLFTSLVKSSVQLDRKKVTSTKKWERGRIVTVCYVTSIRLFKNGWMKSFHSDSKPLTSYAK